MSRGLDGGGIGEDTFEFGDVIEEFAAPEFSEAEEGLRAGSLSSFPDLDELGFLKSLQVAIEIAVREGAEFLEITEEESGGMGCERGEDAEPGLFVNGSIESVIGVAARIGRVVRSGGCGT